MESDQTRHRALADYASDAYRLTDAEFAARHGRAFLLHHGAIGSLKRAARPETVMVDAGRRAADAAPPQVDFLVFPLTTALGAKAAELTIGRAAACDIVIDDESVSMTHATFFQDPEGVVKIVDAGSRNGTFVNEQATPTREAGTPMTLNAGDRVRLGNVAMTFLPVWHFLTLVRRVSE